MQAQNTIVVKDLVLVGGGHTHVQVLRNFGMRPMPGVRVTMISREAAAPYSGMLPGLVAGHYGVDDTHIDLRPLARFANAQFFVDEVVGLDIDTKHILCRTRPPVPYDVLSFNTGTIPGADGVPGAAEHAVPVKPIDRFLARFAAIEDEMGNRTTPVRIGVVGAGAGGVELLLAIRKRITDALGEAGEASFHLITDTDDIMTTHNRGVRKKFRQILAARKIAVHTGHRVVRIDAADGAKLLHCDPGANIPLDHVFWVTTASAPQWLQETGLALSPDGFVAVGDSLQTVTDPMIFAAGDIASVDRHPRPKSGVFAVRQGPPLIRNLRRALAGRPAKPFRPQRHFLSLVTTGDRRAVASWRGLTAHGALIWRWKDRIDRKFMDRFNDLPDMDDDQALELAPGVATPAALRELADHAMRCGGCGAKVGPQILARALDKIAAGNEASMPIGPGQRDDAAVVKPTQGKVTVHSVDGFRSFIEDPYLFGQIAVNHALNDIFAMGAEPQTALAIATLPFGLGAKVEDDLGLMMAGAQQALAAHDTALIGGHTGEGLELALSFAVNGVADEDRILRKGGMAPGERLILTKPIGTGALLAADMRHQAKGRWIDAALDFMLQSGAQAALCFARHDASACTDVSGFGLIGHLLEMLEASGTAATLDLTAVPVMEGAAETIAGGIASSLQRQNEQLGATVEAAGAASDHPSYPLLFDPQTSGGLLASVPADKAEACVTELAGLGYEHAAIIGDVELQSSGAKPLTVEV